MTQDQFSAYKHEATHALMALNDECEKEFGISELPRWDYDLEAGTLTFSENGVPRVIAEIQVAGTTSTSANDWMWGWANESLPPRSVMQMRKVRQFGDAEETQELRAPTLPDDEYLGWEMTAIASRIIGGKGGYRCPGKSGYIYLIYTDIRHATPSDPIVRDSEAKPIECASHGRGYATYICEHLASNPRQQWFSDPPGENNRWPDAWCTECNALFSEQGEWNDVSSAGLKIKLICHGCYELYRGQSAT